VPTIAADTPDAYAAIGFADLTAPEAEGGDGQAGVAERALEHGRSA
jgi:hypothetical protein